MSFSHYRRPRRGNPALLRQLRGEPALSAVDQRATPVEQVFAASTLAVMLLITTYLVLT